MPGRRPPPISVSSPSTPSRPTPLPASLAYFVIFNPTLSVEKKEKEQKGDDEESGSRASPQNHQTEAQALDNARGEGDSASEPVPQAAPAPAERSRDRDLEDDLRDAAQIVFYTSRNAGVSRDTMLRQVGLAKGLMGFSDMVAHSSEPFWAVHSQNTRLVVYTPEPNWYIYICIKLAVVPAKNEVVHQQGISDAMLVEGLQRGYEDYVFLHGPFGDNATPTGLSSLEKYWTRFSHTYEATFVTPPQGLLTWLSGYPPPAESDELKTFVAQLVDGSGAGVLGRDGPIATTDSTDPALTRFLLSTLVARLPVQPKGERQSLGFGFGRRHREKETPDVNDSKEDKDSDKDKQSGPKEKDERKSSWGFSWPLGSSTPTSRAVTPSSASRVASHSASGSIGRRWNLGWELKGVGAVLGLGSPASPNPERGKSGNDKGESSKRNSVDKENKDDKDDRNDKEESKEDADGAPEKDETAAEEGEPAPDAETADGETEQTPTATDALAPVGSLETAALLGTSVQSREFCEREPLTPLPALQTPVSAAPEPQTPRGPDIDDISDTTPEQHALPTLTPKSADTVLPQLAAAVADSVGLTWSCRTVHVDGVERALSWVVRDTSLLYILSPDSTPQEPGIPSDLFALTPPETEAGENTTMYHNDNVTTRTGRLYGADGVLSSLRDTFYHPGAPDEVFGQMHSGRFLVAKKAGSGAELFVVTAREGSLTDAERAVRAYAFVKPEFSS